MEQLEQLLVSNRIKYETNVDLRKRTWIHRGGMADFFVIPQNAVELKVVVSYLYKYDVHHLIMGSSSNIYILNTTHIPVVVSTLKCNQYEIKDGTINCECGVQVSKLAKQMSQIGICGFEYLTKLPGTVGASIYNNSSCMSNSISDLLIDVEMITPTGAKTITAEDLHFAFRTSNLKRGVTQGTILTARLKIEQGKPEDLAKISKKNEEERQLTLEGPAYNLGCTVHKPFCNGAMPIRYRIPCVLYSKIISFFVRDSLRRKHLNKSFLLKLTGHKALIPYISDYLTLIFMWKDDEADNHFEEYLQFMREIYKTDKIEIEII